MRPLLLLGTLACTGLAPFSLAASLAALTACGSAAVDPPAAAPVDPRLYQDAGARPVAHVNTPAEVEAAERASVAAVMAGLSDEGFAEALPKLDPEGNFSFPGLSEATDRDGAVVVLKKLFGGFSNRKFTVGRTFQAKNVTIVDWAMTGTQSGDWLSGKGTGKAVTVRGLGIFWFDPKGLINDTHFYFDVGATLAEFGTVPKGIEATAPNPQLGTDVVTATNSDAEKKNVAIVNASWDALEAKTEAGYLAPFADDVEVFRLDRAAPEKGKADRKKFFHWAAAGIGSLSQTPLNAWGIGPFVIEEYTLTGIHSGKLTDAAPSGHALRLHFVDIDELKDGKIVRTWTYGNSFELYAETREVEKAAPGATGAAIQ